MNSDGLCNTDTLDAFVRAGHEWALAKLVFKERRKECEVYFGLSVEPQRGSIDEDGMTVWSSLDKKKIFDS